MKNNFNFFVIIHFLLISSLNFSMNIEQTLSIPVQPLTLAYLHNDILAVGHLNGCDLINVRTKEKYALSKNMTTYNIIAHPNKKVIATLNRTNSENKVIVYNIEQGNEIWAKNYECSSSITFSPIDDTIFMYHDGIIQDNKGNTYPLKFKSAPASITIACHPTKKEIFYPSDKNALSKIKFDPTFSIKNYPAIANDNIAAIRGTLYNSQEIIFIPYNTAIPICIYNPKTKIIDNCGTCEDIALHPNGFVMALLCTDSVRYWNNNTKKMTCSTMHGEEVDDCACRNRHMIDFSPDGTELAIAMVDKIRRFIVPFETIAENIYQKGTRNKLFTVLSLLKNSNMLLPNEALLPLTKYLLHIHEA